MYWKSNNIKISFSVKRFDIIRELIGSIIIRFNDGLVESVMDYFCS